MTPTPIRPGWRLAFEYLGFDPPDRSDYLREVKS